MLTLIRFTSLKKMVQMLQLAAGMADFAVRLKHALILAISLIYNRKLTINIYILVIGVSLDVYCYLDNYPVVYRRYCTLLVPFNNK